MRRGARFLDIEFRDPDLNQANNPALNDVAQQLRAALQGAAGTAISDGSTTSFWYLDALEQQGILIPLFEMAADGTKQPLGRPGASRRA